MTLAERLVAWQKKSGRHDLPWQNTTDPYRIWVSEIMLQQTQVSTVLGYYVRFMQRFPDVAALASASEEEVLTYWSGLGYYSRARNLQAAARQIMTDFAGVFPRDMAGLMSLRGIGRSTAAAISSFAGFAAQPIMDGNVKRVFCRYFGVDGYPGLKPVEQQLWRLAEQHIPARDAAAYTQGLMDLGATVCTRSKPMCQRCPLVQDCVAYQTDRVSVLPQPRPAKVLPQRQADWLVLLAEGQVFLERRPPSGIWPGLYGFPEVPAESMPVWCQRYFGCEPVNSEQQPQLVHTFSHFRLLAVPHVLHLERMPLLLRDSGGAWLPLKDSINAAVPAPVRRVLQGLLAEQPGSK